MPAFEIHVFRPLITRSLPSRRAVRHHRRHIAAGNGLGDRERRDGLAGSDARQVASLEVVASELRDRPRSKTLHAERKVGHARQLTERLAGETERPNVEPGGARGRYGSGTTYRSQPPTPSRLTISRNVTSTSSGSCSTSGAMLSAAHASSSSANVAMRVREERPRQVARRRCLTSHAIRP